MRIGRIGSRIIMLILSFVGAGVAVDAHVSDTINWFYFHKHYVGSTILSWSGGTIAVCALFECIFLFVRRLVEKHA